MRKNKNLFIILILISILFTGCKEKVEEVKVKLYPAYKIEGNAKKWGYINKKGDFKVKPEYDTTYDYIHGFGLVEKDGLFGVLNVEGEEIIPINYTNIGNFKNGYFTAYRENKIHIFNKEGEELEVKKSYLNIGEFSDGLFIVSEIGKDGKIRFGYINERGEEVIKPIYDAGYNFVKGRAIVKSGDDIKIIDKRGRVKKETKYIEIRPTYEEDYYIFSENRNTYGLIDYEGNIVIKPSFNSIMDVKEDLILVGKIVNGTELFGVIDKNNKEILPAKYDDIINIGDGYLAVSNEMGVIGKNLYQILNIKGVPITDKKFYNVTGRIGNITENMISVSNGEETFFVNTKGEVQKDLPIIMGYGELNYDGEIIRSIVDEELIYFNNKEDVIWEANYTFDLGNDREIIKKKHRDGKNINIDYPLFVGFTNREVQETINKNMEEEFLLKDEIYGSIDVEEYKYYKTIYETYGDKDFAIIEKTSRMMNINSAEENLSKKIFNIDLETGENYKIKDIFKPNSGYLKKINLLVDNLFTTFESIENRKLEEVKDDDCFKIDGEFLYLYLTYDQSKEEIKGYEKIQINLEDIKGILNENNRLISKKILNKGE